MSQGSLGHGLRPGRGRLGHTTLRTFAFSLSQLGTETPGRPAGPAAPGSGPLATGRCCSRPAGDRGHRPRGPGPLDWPLGLERPPRAPGSWGHRCTARGNRRAAGKASAATLTATRATRATARPRPGPEPVSSQTSGLLRVRTGRGVPLGATGSARRLDKGQQNLRSEQGPKC